MDCWMDGWIDGWDRRWSYKRTKATCVCSAGVLLFPCQATSGRCGSSPTPPESLIKPFASCKGGCRPLSLVDARTPLWALLRTSGPVLEARWGSGTPPSQERLFTPTEHNKPGPSHPLQAHRTVPSLKHRKHGEAAAMS